MRDWTDKEAIGNLNLQIQSTCDGDKLAMLNRLKNDLLRRHYNLPFPIKTPEYIYWINRGLQLNVNHEELIRRIVKTV